MGEIDKLKRDMEELWLALQLLRHENYIIRDEPVCPGDSWKEYWSHDYAWFHIDRIYGKVDYDRPSTFS
jgi:hypothetical protein